MKRVLSGAIVLAVVLIVFLSGNTYIVDVALCATAIACIYELFGAFEKKGHHPIKWVAYLTAIILAVNSMLPAEYSNTILIAIIPISVVLVFAHLILSKGKNNATDVAITIFGIVYIVLFLSILSKIYAMENGIFLIWYVFISAWLTDVAALYTGKTIGKHHFTDISPNKTIEGCIGGIIGAVIFVSLYTFLINKFAGFNIDYILMGISAIILSVIGQIGDLAASSIKRYAGIKDFSNLIPEHGGVLDRIDSIIFVAPFAYLLLSFMI